MEQGLCKPQLSERGCFGVLIGVRSGDAGSSWMTERGPSPSTHSGTSGPSFRHAVSFLLPQGLACPRLASLLSAVAVHCAGCVYFEVINYLF